MSESDDRVLLMDRLLGDDAAELVAPALPYGARVLSLEPAQILTRPGVRTSVRYDCDLEVDNAVRTLAVVALCDRRGLPGATRRVEVDGEELAVWAVPDDPRLPGLRIATNHHFVMQLLRALGNEVEDVDIEMRAYRPGLRAVVEVRAQITRPGKVKLALGAGGGLRRLVDEHRFFLKVMRPNQALEAAERYSRLTGTLPIAACHVVDRELGVLILTGVPGKTLGSRIRRGRPLPPPSALIELQARFDAVDLPGEPYAGVDATTQRHARLLKVLLPEAAERIDRLVAAIGTDTPQPIANVHADFHEGQILVEDGIVTGIVDIDDAAPGERVDDLGLLAGRLWSLGQDRPETDALAYCEELIAESDRLVDPSELRRRIAVAVFGRATGPFRNLVDDWQDVARHRIDLAEKFVDEVLL